MIVVAETDSYELTWGDIRRGVRHLASAVERDGPPDILIGIVRGGWVPAAMLAHTLKVRDVRAVEITHTTADVIAAAKSPEPVVINPASLGELSGADVLIVDDVAGSGMTVATGYELVRARGARRIRTAVCVVNEENWSTAHDPGDGEGPNYVVWRRPGWVVFPWERP
jgi:hypothetical protein